MDKNLVQFPVSDSKRRKNARGKNVAECIISDRFLRFTHSGDCGKDHMIGVEVLTSANGTDKLLSRLDVPISELTEALKQLAIDILKKRK